MRPSLGIGLAIASAAAAAQDVIVTADKLDIHGCDEIAYYSPGKLERFEGVYYSWIDNNGFVPCATAADCKRFLDFDSWGIRATEDGWVQIHDWQTRYKQNWGTYRASFLGRRGAMNLPAHCLDHTLPDVPLYVQVEKVLHMAPLDQPR